MELIIPLLIFLFIMFAIVRELIPMWEQEADEWEEHDCDDYYL